MFDELLCRRPEGTARALLRVAESHPEAVLEALHR